MARRRKTTLRPNESRPGQPSVAESSVDEAAGDATSVFWLIVLCFLLSGAAALVYQTAWLRQFSIVFGTSDLAVATVLAAYMGGLAAGATLIARFQHRIDRPVLAYGLLEAGIGLAALAVPILIAAASSLFVALLGGRPTPPPAAGIGQTSFYLVVAFVVLALPAGFMGATLPLLTRYAVRADPQVGPRLALLYAVNTAGAVAGTIAAAFLLLPALGLRGTVWCGVAINALVFLIARHCARRITAKPVPAPHPGSASPVSLAALRAQLLDQPAWILPLMLVSGAVAFAYEVLWTRLLTHVVGGSVYAFAIMLAAFLSGIALGSGAAGALARRREHAAPFFAGAQIGIAALSALVYALLGSLIPDGRSVAELALYAVAVMLPATFLIGATFPLSVRLLAADEREASVATARVYAWNTAGAIAGSLLTGFWLLPRLGFEGLIALATLTNLGLALSVLVLTTRVRRGAVALTSSLIAAAVVWYRPGRPTAVVTHAAFPVASESDPREVYYEVGRTATVLVEEADGQFHLRANGLPEAAISVAGALPLGHVDRWLTALAVAARPAAAKLLLVGLGGGVAIERVPRSIATIDVIELEPAVIAANRAVASERAVDPLADPRVRLVVNDARNALRLTDERYDIIVSQPSHPWTAGASHLYTREFAALVKERLAPDGVFVQWVGAGFITEPLLRSLVASLDATFAAVRLYQSGGSALILLASDRSLDLERRALASGEPLRSNVLEFSRLGLNSADDFAAALVMDERATREFSEGAMPITDDFNRMATDSGVFADGLDAVELVDQLAENDSLLDPTSPIHSELGSRINFVNVAIRLLHDGFTRRVEALASVASSSSDRAFIDGLVKGARGEPEAARRAFEAALAAAPRSTAIRYALVEPRLAELAGNRAGEQTLELAAGLTGSAAAVIRGWRLAAVRDWSELARLEEALAAANPTDLWYPEAIRLRAEWRVQSGDSAYAGDALRMIDRALMIRPKLELLLLRAAAADAAGDHDAFVETARNIAMFVRAGLAPGSAQALPPTSVLRGPLVALRSNLDSLGNRARRAREVADEIDRLLNRFAN